jgi:transformation/transcription domain-associated protein
MMFGLTDTIISKETSQGAGQLLEAMFETCLKKLEGLCVVQSEVSTTLERNKQTSKEITNIVPNASFIEKARPVGGAINATEKTQLGLCTIPIHTGYSCHMLATGTVP